MQLDENSSTLSPLGDVLSHGLVAVSTFGLLSFFCSLSLFSYLSYRLISWRFKSKSNYPINQFLFLIYNLLLADIQQACAFLLNISALQNNAILVGTPTCFAQGWFVSTGDLASSVFIFAIAAHTFLGVMKNYRFPTKTFYFIVGMLWAFIYAMAAIGPIIHGKDFYVRASAWCWINDAFSIERLCLHYLWIFICMFSTIILYSIIFLYLRHGSKASQISSSISGVTPLMILYPLIYTVCTAPLAAGRIYALAGHDVSLGYFCAAGTMIACNGWLDVLLYASTRADIVFSEFPPGQETGLETFAFMGKGHSIKLGTVTTIEALGDSTRVGSRLGGSRMGMRSGPRRSGDSFENLYGMDTIAVKGEVTVSVDTEGHGMVRQDRPRDMETTSVGRDESGSGDDRSVKSMKSVRSVRTNQTTESPRLDS